MSWLKVDAHSAGAVGLQAPTAPSGAYSEAELNEFNSKLGPGAGVALESLRKNAGIRIKATKRSGRSVEKSAVKTRRRGR